ncbi:MAG: hypothetical protein KatS3mg081_2603 [Gemmatimonadales bacterium]|nr:MAG: hypothetical protein KatS3mg081_2603 [Gemmatimonadales bacterium]
MSKLFTNRWARLISSGFYAGVAALLFCFCSWKIAAAQQDPRLERVDPQARPAVVAIIDSAVAAGLPAEPLIDRALEGTSKKAPAPLIIAAVRRLAGDLGKARELLGPGARAAELIAAADALRWGTPSQVLLRIQRELGNRGLAVPLGLTADLAARGVPPDTAAAMVIAAARRVTDADLLALQRELERSIALGAEPVAASAAILVEVAAPGTGLSGEPTMTGGPARRKP